MESIGKMMMEPFLLPLLSAWLNLYDLVKLDSASCRKLHAIITEHLQSSHFKQLHYDNLKHLVAFPSVDALWRLKWALNRQADVPGMVLDISDPATLNQIYHDTSLSIFPFISKVLCRADGGLPFDDFYDVMRDRFTAAEALSITCDELQETDAQIDHILSIVVSLTQVRPFKSITFDLFWWDTMDSNQLTMLSTLLQSVGETLEHFQLHSSLILPIEILGTAVTYCPNLKSFFNHSRLDTTITRDDYLPLCQRLPELQSLRIGSNCLRLRDDDLIPLLDILPCLKDISIEESDLTIASLLYAYQKLPNLTFANIAGVAFTKNIEAHNKGVKVSSAVELNNVMTEDITECRLLQFLKTIPPITKLSICSYLSPDNSLLLASQLSQAEFSQVNELSVEHKALVAAEHLLPLLSNIKELYLMGYLQQFHDYFEFEDMIMNACNFITSLVDYCRQITALRMSSMEYLTDQHIDILCLGLQNLTHLSIARSAPLLTKQFLIYMATGGRVWEYLCVPTSRCNITEQDIQEVVDTHGLNVKICSPPL